jgi:biopolymer transport protein ExbD
VVSESSVTKPDETGDVIKYADLATKLGEEWKLHGGHQDKSDKKIDQAVLHADNKLPFKQVIGVLDALYATQRKMVLDGKEKDVPVFNMSFSVR